MNVSKLPGELLRYRAEVLPLHKTRAVAKFPGLPLAIGPELNQNLLPELRILASRTAAKPCNPLCQIRADPISQ